MQLTTTSFFTLHSTCLISLLNIHQVFGRVAGGCDLTDIGGVKRGAATYIASTMTNWAKNYSDVRIVDQSPTGLWEKQSVNLIDLL